MRLNANIGTKWYGQTMRVDVWNIGDCTDLPKYGRWWWSVIFLDGDQFIATVKVIFRAQTFYLCLESQNSTLCHDTLQHWLQGPAAPRAAYRLRSHQMPQKGHVAKEWRDVAPKSREMMYSQGKGALNREIYAVLDANSTAQLLLTSASSSPCDSSLSWVGSSNTWYRDSGIQWDFTDDLI
jgi:hypothetical protein